MTRALVWVIFRPAREGTVEYRGQVHSFPLPRFSTHLAEMEGRSAYLTLDRSQPVSWLAGQAERQGWNYVEQMGAAHILTRGGYRLTVITRQCPWRLSLLEFIVTD